MVKTVHIGLRYPHDLVSQEMADNIASLIKLHAWSTKSIEDVKVPYLHTNHLRIDIVMLANERELHQAARKIIRRAAQEAITMMPRRFTALQTDAQAAHLLLAA